jgi:exodeoxyribonuclease V gamma subunit
MIRLVYSNRTEELLDELAAKARAQQSRFGPLVPVRVVVPSASVEAYLRLGVARQQGVAANLDFARLTAFAGEVVAAVSGARVANASALEAMALRLLLDDAALERAELAPVRAYLRGGGEVDDPMDMRRAQLASRLGRLFEEYTYSRGDMLAAWRQGTTFGDAHAETEAWQRSIWLAMFGEGGLAERGARSGSQRLVPLHEAVAALVPEAGMLPRAVHVFGFAHVARSYNELFERLAPIVDVAIYSLSPCEGFWEDPDARDPAPLHLWGRPGRDQVRALNAISRFDHDDRFVDPLETGERTLLRQIQHDVLYREPARESIDPSRPFEGDTSFVVLEHASVRRELEAVASEIWRLVEADENLRFDDIAVLVPEGDDRGYAAQVSAVFREAHDLPHRAAVAASVARGGSVVEAVELLLSLPLGRFTRRELLRVVLHPALVGSMDDVDPVRWAAWCEALGVVHGADRGDHAETYIKRDILNWDQGLRRLALGAFMGGDASGDGRAFESAGEAYFPHEVTSAELHDAAAFGVLVRSLLADARFARDAELTMREWAGFLRTMVEAYVAPTGSAEEEQLARCLRQLYSIGDVDLGESRVRYRIASEIARGRLATLPGAHAGEGVVVTTLASLRPQPFRVVFACGMGEGQFPSPDAEDPLDLRWVRRREGDVTARERDKYAFLELLLAVRDRLYASYVSREPLTGEAIAPSSVIEELLHAIERGYAGHTSSLRRRHPLRRWDPAYFPELFGSPVGDRGHLGTMRLPEARAEARTLALRRSLDGSGQSLGAHDVLVRAAADRTWGDLADHLGLVRLPETASFPEGRLAVPLYAIVKFLEFPLQGWARFRVGLDERDDEDLMAREDEPFETDVRKETVFLREVLLDSVGRGCSLEEAYDDAVRGKELRGTGPSGVFAEGERVPHLETLASWRAELETRGEPVDAIEIYRFGRAGEHARAGKVFDAVVVDVDAVDGAGVMRVLRVEIAGRTLPMGAGAGASITLTKRPKERWDDAWVSAERDRASVRAFVDHAVLSASGVGANRPHASMIVVSTPDGPISERVSFDAMSRDEASAWLRGVLRDLLQGPHAYFFPCEAVFVRARRDPAGPVTPCLEEARDLLGDSEGPLSLRSAYGPVPRPHEYPAPDEERARSMIATRFGAFFDKRVGTT